MPSRPPSTRSADFARRASDRSVPVLWNVVTAIEKGGRRHQEDSVGTWMDLHGGEILAVVADGAGGHGGGAEASAMAVDEARRLWESDAWRSEPQQVLSQWLLDAHTALKRGAPIGSRAAAVAMLAIGRRVHWVHAGDCRLYHFRGMDRLSRTRDDSVVQILFEQGEITEREMGRHEDQNRLLQALGGDDPPTPRTGSAVAEPGDVFILCSDGFWENLDTEELGRLATAPEAGRSLALQGAMKLAMERGGAGADNTSVVIASLRESSGAEVGRVLCGKTRTLIVFLAVVAAITIAVLAVRNRWQVPLLWERPNFPERAPVEDKSSPKTPDATSSVPDGD